MHSSPRAITAPVLLLLSLLAPACSKDAKKSQDASLPGSDGGLATVIDAPLVPDVTGLSDVPLENDAEDLAHDGGGDAVDARVEASFPNRLESNPRTVTFVGDETHTLLIANLGPGPAGPLFLELSGSSANWFDLSSAGCDTLLPGGWCTVVLRSMAVPPNICTSPMVLTATDLRTRGAVAVPILVSSPPPPPLVITPPTLDFGRLYVTSRTTTETFTLQYNQNPCAKPAMAGPFTVTSSNPEFTITTDTCSSGQLADKGTCTFKVYFHPLTLGPRTSVVRVEDSSFGEASIALTGTSLPMP